MSEKLPTRKEALKILSQTGCSTNVIKHCKAVAKLAVEIVKIFEEKGLQINRESVEIGALLHDIGRSKTHTVHHAIEGARIAESMNIPSEIIKIIKRHVGGGIGPEEADHLGWPKGTYVPETFEEKIVSYADKLVEGSDHVTIERTIEKFRFDDKIPSSAVTKLEELHEEMMSVLGDHKCLQ